MGQLKSIKMNKLDQQYTELLPLTLVKWNYDSLPEEWRSKNPNPYGDITFIYFGEVNGMKGHAYLQCIKTGKSFILHTDELLPLTEDEL